MQQTPIKINISTDLLAIFFFHHQLLFVIAKNNISNKKKKKDLESCFKWIRTLCRRNWNPSRARNRSASVSNTSSASLKRSVAASPTSWAFSTILTSSLRSSRDELSVRYIYVAYMFKVLDKLCLCAETFARIRTRGQKEERTMYTKNRQNLRDQVFYYYYYYYSPFSSSFFVPSLSLILYT